MMVWNKGFSPLDCPETAGSDSCDAGLKEVDCKFMEGKNCTARASAMLTWVNRRVALDCWGALEMFNSEDT